MPSKLQQLHYLGLRVLAWVLWLPFTGNPRHDRTWGELKRLNPREAVLLSAPLAGYVGVATWLYLFFPRELYAWAGSVWGLAVLLGGTLFGSTVVITKVIDWSHVYANR